MTYDPNFPHMTPYDESFRNNPLHTKVPLDDTGSGWSALAAVASVKRQATRQTFPQLAPKQRWRTAARTSAFSGRAHAVFMSKCNRRKRRRRSAAACFINPSSAQVPRPHSPQ